MTQGAQDNVTLNDYIINLINLSGEAETPEEMADQQAKTIELERMYGDRTVTYKEAERAIQMMIASVMQDIAVGEQVQGVFNQSLLEVLTSKGIITDRDYTNIADIMQNATAQLYKEIGGVTDDGK